MRETKEGNRWLLLFGAEQLKLLNNFPMKDPCSTYGLFIWRPANADLIINDQNGSLKEEYHFTMEWLAVVLVQICIYYHHQL